jgi:hypothetical protein
MVYPALLPLMRTPRLPVVNWTDAPADLNGLVRFAERRNLVSARVPSHFNWPLLETKSLIQAMRCVVVIISSFDIDCTTTSHWDLSKIGAVETTSLNTIPITPPSILISSLPILVYSKWPHFRKFLHYVLYMKIFQIPIDYLMKNLFFQWVPWTLNHVELAVIAVSFIYPVSVAVSQYRISFHFLNISVYSSTRQI